MLHPVGQAVVLAAGMFWQVAWSLILGFVLSGMIQAFVSKERMTAQLGKNGVREIALASAYGAASSSCSYAAAAMSKTLFKKGAGLIPSLAFLFSSTNLVVELGIILYLLMGWQFTIAEWVGGVLLVAIMALIVKATYPRRLVDEARRHVKGVTGDGEEIAEGSTLRQKLSDPESWIRVAQNFTMDWSMLWKDLFGGFLIAGALSTFVPNGVWSSLFLHGAPPWMQIPANAIVGPLIAVVSFVCSIGNVPMAAILWGSGISFGGVLSFLYADLIVLPLLDVYRRYYGWKMAAYIGAVFFVTMVVAGIIMQVAFGVFNAIPTPSSNVRAQMIAFSINYTFWLNLAFGALALYLWYLGRRRPAMEHCHMHPEG